MGPAQLHNHSRSQEMKRYESGEVIKVVGPLIRYAVIGYYNSGARCVVIRDTATDYSYSSTVFARGIFYLRHPSGLQIQRQRPLKMASAFPSR